MKIVLDMNLPPIWTSFLGAEGYEVKHWSEIGAIDAPDTEIMEWARKNDFVVFTHDLDFGALLYATKATAPSVIQLRIEDIRPESVGEHTIWRNIRLGNMTAVPRHNEIKEFMRSFI